MSSYCFPFISKVLFCKQQKFVWKTYLTFVTRDKSENCIFLNFADVIGRKRTQGHPTCPVSSDRLLIWVYRSSFTFQTSMIPLKKDEKSYFHCFFLSELIQYKKIGLSVAMRSESLILQKTWPEIFWSN